MGWALVIIMLLQKMWSYLIHRINGSMTGNVFLFLSFSPRPPSYSYNMSTWKLFKVYL